MRRQCWSETPGDLLDPICQIGAPPRVETRAIRYTAVLYRIGDEMKGDRADGYCEMVLDPQQTAELLYRCHGGSGQSAGGVNDLGLDHIVRDCVD